MVKVQQCSEFQAQVCLLSMCMTLGLSIANKQQSIVILLVLTAHTVLTASSIVTLCVTMQHSQSLHTSAHTAMQYSTKALHRCTTDHMDCVLCTLSLKIQLVIQNCYHCMNSLIKQCKQLLRML